MTIESHHAAYLTPVRPAHRETFASYTQRILTANGETPAHREHLINLDTDSRDPGLRAQTWRGILEAKTGRDLSRLEATDEGLPAHPDGTRCGACADQITQRWMCTQCADGATISQHPHLETLVCVHHHRFIGMFTTPDQQSAATPEQLNAAQQLTKLRRRNPIDARLYRTVVTALRADNSRYPRPTEADVFSSAIGLIRTLTSTAFLLRLLNPHTPFGEAYAWLASMVAAATGLDNKGTTRALWLYLRPTCWALRHMVITGTPYMPAWPHDLRAPQAVIDLYRCTPHPLESFSEYLTAANLTADDAYRSGADFDRPDPNANTAPRKLPRMLTICPAGHQFATTVPSAQRLANRRNHAPACPVCTHKQVQPGYNDLATQYPHIAAEFDKELNGDLTAEQVAPASHGEYFWRCPAGHSYTASASNRTKARMNCGLCTNRTVVPGINDLTTTHPHIAAQATGPSLGGVHVTHLSSGSDAFVPWRCPEGHDYMARVHERTRGRDCPTCARHHIAANKLSLADSHPEIAAEWHPDFNGNFLPEHVTHGSKREVWWQCSFGHSYRERVERRTAGYKCKVCSKRGLVPGVNDLATTDPELISEFHTYRNGPKEPHQLFAGTTNYWWKCKAHRHEYQQSVPHRRKSHGCPRCVPEERVLNRQ